MAKQKKVALAAVILCFLLLLIIGGGILFKKTELQRSDFRRISSEAFDTAFLSMYPIATYPESDLTYYRGMTVFKAANTLSDFQEIQQYMKRLARSGNIISTVYLGVRPDRVSVEQLAGLTQSYPSVCFEFILAAPSASYWQSLSDGEYAELLNIWQSFLAEAGQLSGARFYFYAAEEWLITNPALYLEDFLFTADAASFILANSDYLHPYLLTAGNAGEKGTALEDLTASLRAGAISYPDFSDTAIVFFGDSIFGNYTDGMSIPGAVRGLTGAAVYNCGYGGNTASVIADSPVTLPGIVEDFFAGELSRIPADAQVYQGFLAYQNDPPVGQKLCYIINYGLNDYLKSCPVASEDPFDVTTYSGAVRTAVACIREHSADAQIILCTPTWSGYALDETEDSAVHLSDYADTVLALAEELEADAIDNFYSLGIDASNYTEYLPDLIHPNEEGRFLIAKKLIGAIR